MRLSEYRSRPAIDTTETDSSLRHRSTAVYIMPDQSESSNPPAAQSNNTAAHRVAGWFQTTTPAPSRGVNGDAQSDTIPLTALSSSSSSSSLTTYCDLTGVSSSGGVHADSEDGLLELQRPSRDAASSSGDEGWLVLAVQVFVPYMIAGFGMVGAGIVLDVVQHWPVFDRVSELFILVPALLGLKGNLEMTLASRLSTQANLGLMNDPADMWSLIVSNMGLIQCQALVVGFLASTVAVVMGWIPDGEFNFQHTLLLCASSVVTASLASFLLGSVMLCVIVLSHRWKVNPDNVATPIAASMGDLVTLALLASISSLLFNAMDTSTALSPCIIAVFLLFSPLTVWIAYRNQHTRVVLYEGWTPVIAAMLISSMGGLILDFAVSAYAGIAVFQPVINGVGGNLVAVQASRISTDLHSGRGMSGHSRSKQRHSKTMEADSVSPTTVFCTAGGHSQTARVLLCMVIPGHLVFTYCISYLRAGHTTLTPTFLVVYNCAALLQVVILLYVAHCMIQRMWKCGIDPDNSAIPYLTALGDLLGTGLLALAFQILYVIGDGDADLGD